MKETPSYYAILPANVRYDPDLKPMEKIMFAEITALSNKDGFCSATNGYFAELYDVDESTVSRWIGNLSKRGYLSISLVRDERKAIIGRHLFTTPIDKKVNRVLTKKSIPSPQKDQYPIDKKVKENNTSINTTSNNNSLSPNAENPENKNAPQWGDNSETRLQKAQSALNEYFAQNPERWKELSNQARNQCSETDFQTEIDLWLRRNADDFAITQNPVKALTSGRGNFISWLAQTWCRQKYQQHETTTQTGRNGRVQQRGPLKTSLTFEEFQRRQRNL